jgi:hypothetical protein
MKYFFLATVMLISIAVIGQQKTHKIVYDINAADTTAQSMLLRQCNNVLNADPNAKIVVVYHGNAIKGLVKDSAYFSEKIKSAQQRGVVFEACNNSLKRVNIDPSRVLPGVIVVPVAALELAERQQDGWSYIKAGD